MLIEQCAWNAGANVCRCGQRCDTLQVRVDARDGCGAIGIAEAPGDMLGENERLVRANLHAQVTAVAAPTLAGDVDTALRDDVALQCRELAVHADRLRPHAGLAG